MDLKRNLEADSNAVWQALTAAEKVAVRLYAQALQKNDVPAGLFGVIQDIHEKYPAFSMFDAPIEE
jgi:hypothetical protein